MAISAEPLTQSSTATLRVQTFAHSTSCLEAPAASRAGCRGCINAATVCRCHLCLSTQCLFLMCSWMYTIMNMFCFLLVAWHSSCWLQEMNYTVVFQMSLCRQSLELAVCCPAPTDHASPKAWTGVCLVEQPSILTFLGEDVFFRLSSSSSSEGDLMHGCFQLGTSMVQVEMLVTC